MQTFVRHYDLRPADRVTVPKSGINIVQHDALYLGYDENGTHWFAENHAGRGVRLVEADEFFSINTTVNQVHRFTGTDYQRRAAVEKALALLGKPYNLIVYNCQHFATEVQTGKAVSRQVEGTAIGILLFILLGALLSTQSDY